MVKSKNRSGSGELEWAGLLAGHSGRALGDLALYGRQHHQPQPVESVLDVAPGVARGVFDDLGVPQVRAYKSSHQRRPVKRHARSRVRG